ncbi:hypothetical protein [Halalkalicoccus sp. NIPERK01]|uniref:hypothetical protein n=1 Tax=Halalkalicoccus sp. NIPERK01 TaxID=3053469 RepID=UPI00256EC07B|nr:hypothetical protein [Halalkalicoccus sp. NIPERK01]MDL5361249.1 hypothetical protein [Halalkalicoccus sp. NIPERK01]
MSVSRDRLIERSVRVVSVIVIGLMVFGLLFETIGVDVLGSLAHVVDDLTLQQHGVIAIGIVLLTVSVVVEKSCNMS